MTAWELNVKRFEDADERKISKKLDMQVRAMRQLEYRRQGRHKLDHSVGYCPICHTLKALNGECSC